MQRMSLMRMSREACDESQRSRTFKDLQEIEVGLFYCYHGNRTCTHTQGGMLCGANGLHNKMWL